jgi:hypothetical protein
MEQISAAANSTLKHRGIALVRYEHVLAALLLGVVLSLFYRDIVFGARTFIPSVTVAGTMPISDGAIPYGYPPDQKTGVFLADPGSIAWKNDPYVRRAAEAVREGEFPLWSPNSAMGELFFADGLTSVLEPIQVLSYLASPEQWPLAYDLQVLLRYYLAGLFTYLFARRLGLGLVPAVVAGIAFMVQTYFVLYGNHQQLKADTLIPFALYSYERLFQRRSFGNIALVAFAVAWAIIASFAQAGFLVLGIATLWYAFRAGWQIVVDRFRRQTVVSLTLPAAASVVLGLALSAVLWLPFLENVRLALHLHGPGVGMLAWPPLLAVQSFLPVFVGGLWAPLFYTTILVLGGFGLAGWLNRELRQPAIFFGLYGTALYLKLYNVPLVTWIGLLPGYEQILLIKYAMPSIAICFAVLAGCGLHAMLTGGVSVRWGAVVTVGFLGAVGYVVSIANPVQFVLWRLALGSAFVMTLIIGLFATLVLARSRRFARLAPVLALALVVGEVLTWHSRLERPLRYDPYTTPPFVTFLREQPQPMRVFAFDGILFPDVSTAYDIDDIRYLVALIPERRLAYLTQFVAPGEVVPFRFLNPGETISHATLEQMGARLLNHGDLTSRDLVELSNVISRMNGLEPLFYVGPHADLLNTQYFLNSLAAPPRRAVNLLNQSSLDPALARPPLIEKRSLTIGGQTRETLFLHPPASVQIPVLLPPGAPQLAFGTTTDPLTWGSDTPGGGVAFRVTVTDAAGEHQVFSRTIDPQQNSGERGWNDSAVELSRWSGQRVVLTFSTNAGPAGEASNDWAYWSAPILRIPTPPSPWAAERLAAVDTALLAPAIVDQNMAMHNSAFYIRSLAIDGDERSTLFMHADNYADITIRIPDGGATLGFAVGMDPLTWAEGAVSDGAGFRVTVIDTEGETELFSRLLVPQRRPEDRTWIEASLDLARWHGREVTLRFATDGGSAGQTAADWTHWANITLHGAGVGTANPALARFELVYDEEIQIYRNNYAYPRAFVVREALVASDMDEAIRLMARSDFDPSRQAVVEGPLPAGWESTLTPGASSADDVRVVRPTMNTLEVTATLAQPGVLVLSESYNPGWHVTVDGQPVPLLIANVFMRGVYLEAGTHTVRFWYLPLSFQIGAAVSLASLTLLAAAALLVAMRRRARPTAAG